MKLTWEVSPGDVDKVRAIVAQYWDHPFVAARVRSNVDGHRPALTRERFWHALVGCLLSTQQRSGPKSLVGKFLIQEPFPLAFDACQRADLVEHASVLLSAEGIRRGATIAEQLAKNCAYLEQGGWGATFDALDEIQKADGRDTERKVAKILAHALSGIGPKQSRNLLQSLGLTRHEIPIDSRITDWLNRLPTSPKLGAAALADDAFYDLVMDGIVELCTRADVLPCVLDAAVFASFDPADAYAGNARLPWT